MSGYAEPEATPSLTADQAAETIRILTEELAIDPVQLAENVGRNLGHLARIRFLAGDAVDRTVVVLAGAGGNGAGALACARRLQAWGAYVFVYPVREEGLAPVTGRLLEQVRLASGIVNAPGLIVMQSEPDLVIDGLVGSGLREAPTGPVAELVHWAADQEAPVLALDVPTGVDPTSGDVHHPAVRATATMAVGLPKAGTRATASRAHVGELYVADPGYAGDTYAWPALGLSVGPIFSRGDVVRLR